MRRTDEEMTEAQLAVQNQLNLILVNHCMPGILSKCGAGTKWAEQRFCKFAVKSDFANKCMFYNSAIDGHCDCMDAQADAVKIFEDLYE
jgi:hypothetical protein